VWPAKTKRQYEFNCEVPLDQLWLYFGSRKREKVRRYCRRRRGPLQDVQLSQADEVHDEMANENNAIRCRPTYLRTLSWSRLLGCRRSYPSYLHSTRVRVHHRRGWYQGWSLGRGPTAVVDRLHWRIDFWQNKAWDRVPDKEIWSYRLPAVKNHRLPLR